jgi:hypothetical protein
VLEIACDESGFTGTNLTIAGTVFAHASLQIDRRSAEQLIGRLRSATGAPDGELKANWLLRRRTRALLRGLLTSDVVSYQARVHLTDSRYFLLGRILDLCLTRDPMNATDVPGRSERVRSVARMLATRGPRWYGETRWHRFLALGGDLMRVHSRRVSPVVMDDFFATVEELATLPSSDVARAALVRLPRARGMAELRREALGQAARPVPLLEPLIPALTRAALWWGAGTDLLRIAHDEQSVLTSARIDEIAAVLESTHPGSRLEVLRVDSHHDARVQVADLIAGIARRAAGSLLIGRPEPELVELVRPLIDPDSIWPDVRVWQLPVGCSAGIDR